MDGKWMSRLVAVWMGALGLLPIAAVAAPPWERLLTANRVEADPNRTYTITEENGPWMIMVQSFSGDGAEEQARQLVLELRKRYKLPAYMHPMHFEFGETNGLGVDRYGGPVRMRYQRGPETREIGVLVGNYSSVDDPDAQEALKRIKYMRPETLEVQEGKKINSSLAGLRYLQKQFLPANNEKRNRGPMSHAFVTTNPVLPKEFFASKGLDPFVVKMNDKVEFSLLKCPGKYTVQVAHFTGRVILDQKEIRAVKSGKQIESKLAEAADKAHRMTEALRRKGYEAYEFHDRAASIVTVGSFNQVGTPRQDGRTEIDPKIHAIMKTFGGEQVTLPGQASASMKPKSITEGRESIPFDIQPIPVEVPRQSISAAYSRTASR
jgi:hypothetical protein